MRYETDLIRFILIPKTFYNKLVHRSNIKISFKIHAWKMKIICFKKKEHA